MTATSDFNTGATVEAARPVATAQVAPLPSQPLLTSHKTPDTSQYSSADAVLFYIDQHYSDLQSRVVAVETDIKHYKDNITIKRISDIENNISKIEEKIKKFEENVSIKDIIRIKDYVDRLNSDKPPFATIEQIANIEQQQKIDKSNFKNNVMSYIGEYLDKKSEKRISSKMYWMMIIGTFCGIISVVSQLLPLIRSVIK